MIWDSLYFEQQRKKTKTETCFKDLLVYSWMIIVVFVLFFYFSIIYQCNSFIRIWCTYMSFNKNDSSYKCCFLMGQWIEKGESSLAWTLLRYVLDHPFVPHEERFSDNVLFCVFFPLTPMLFFFYNKITIKYCFWNWYLQTNEVFNTRHPYTWHIKRVTLISVNQHKR